MDRGIGLNIFYAETLDSMSILRRRLHPTFAPFYRVVPRMQAVPLGQIHLPVTRHAQQLLEDFVGTYYALLGWPRYAKFTIVPDYT